ncbi:MAG TPA: DUF1697 domain-containing protein [Actinomycetota bacterium]|nr:DUF1697 domain-containing protein [Actinomycetota bacterium]
MDTWVVLLRGINVGGRNVIAMRDLRQAFAHMGFHDPATYIQSGNVVVGSRRVKGPRAASSIERRLSEAFGYDARVVVRDLAEMTKVVRQIPKDWDVSDRSMRHNVIFVTDAITPREIVESVIPKPAVESVRAGDHAVYWSAPFETLTKTAMIKLSSHPLYPEMTIRNLRTTLRLLEMMRRPG